MSERPRWSSKASTIGSCIMSLEFAAIHYRTIRERIRAKDPHIDEQTLADTVEGLTDLHEIVAAVIRSVLADEALSTGLKSPIADMQQRLDRLQTRASKRRPIATNTMFELDIKRITAPDFTVSIRRACRLCSSWMKRQCPVFIGSQ